MKSISLLNISFAYSGSDDLFTDLSYSFGTDKKVAIIGNNGAGKTTFLKLLLDKYEYKGTISKNVEFDYFPFEIKNKERMTIEVVNEIAPNVEDWEIIKELNLLNTHTEIL